MKWVKTQTGTLLNLSNVETIRIQKEQRFYVIVAKPKNRIVAKYEDRKTAVEELSHIEDLIGGVLFKKDARFPPFTPATLYEVKKIGGNTNGKTTNKKRL